MIAIEALWLACFVFIIVKQGMSDAYKRGDL